MKIFSFFFCTAAALLLWGCQSFQEEKPADLVFRSDSRYQIVYPDRHRNPGTSLRLKKTAEFLHTAFKETIGAEFPVVRESQRREGVKSIFLGNTRTLKAKGARPLHYKDFEYRIWESEGNLYMAGSDRHRFKSSKIQPDHHSYVIGTAAAVVAFMEKFMDVRFLYPGMTGIDFVRKQEIRIPGRFKYKGKPNLRFAPGKSSSFFYDYAHSNFGPGPLLGSGGDSFRAALPEEKYGKKNPGYFALQKINGTEKRVSRGSHPCISKKEVKKLILEKLFEAFDRGAEVVELGRNVKSLPCLCEDCAKYGSSSDLREKLWIFYRKIAEKALKKHPDKKIAFIAWGPVASPPQTFKKFPSNVMIELCSPAASDFEAWSKIKVPGGFLVRINTWGWSNMPGLTPKRTPEFAAARARLFVKNKVAGICRNGFGENFGLEGPAYYVFGKILEDPSRDEKKILDEFYGRAFRESRESMTCFFNTLYARLKLYSVLEPTLTGNPRVLLGMIYTPELVNSLESHLAQAEMTAKSPKVKKRIQLVRMEFDYVRNLSRIIVCYNVCKLFPTKKNMDLLLDAVEARNRMIDGFYDAKGKIKRLPGWPELPLFGNVPLNIMKTNGSRSASILTPLKWDVNKMRQKKLPSRL